MLSLMIVGHAINQKQSLCKQDLPPAGTQACQSNKENKTMTFNFWTNTYNHAKYKVNTCKDLEIKRS